MSQNLKTVLIIGGILIGVITILSVIPGLIWGRQENDYGMMGSGMMGGNGTMFLMPILGIVVVGFIIWAVIAATHRSGESDCSYGSMGSAQEILKKRYARGEISKAEYEEKKRDLV